MDEFLRHIGDNGFAVIQEGVPSFEIDRLSSAVADLQERGAGERRGGVRDLFAVLPTTREVAGSSWLRPWVAAVLGPGCFAVRGILFDKTETSNWKVPWHQDVTIAVRARREVPGFGPWSTKKGIAHVQPPIAILERMLAVRVHLDDSGWANGPLRVIAGSHKHGILLPGEVEIWRQRVPAQECHVPRGGLLLMRPLLLHASSEASAPVHRRVLHLEYAADELPGGLEWHERWGNGAGASDHPLPASAAS